MKKEYSFKEVCAHYKIHSAPLVEKKSPLYLDCMGTKVNAMKFCKEMHTLSPLLTRGLVSDNKVICEKSTYVNLGIACDGKHKSLCGEAKGSCLNLKPSFAMNMHLNDWRLEGRYLNCKYSPKKTTKNSPQQNLRLRSL